MFADGLAQDKSAVGEGLSRRAKILGTLFLVLQLAFAAWSFGPHRIPVIRWFVEAPAPAASGPSIPAATWHMVA